MNVRQIAWRNMNRRKMRTVLTLLSIVIGVSAAFGVIASVETAKKTFPLYLKAAFGKADYAIYGTEAYFGEEAYRDVRQMEGVEAVAVLKETTQLALEQDGIAAIQRRVDLKGYSELDTPLTNFRLLDGDLSAGGAVITDRTAGVWKIGVGDRISFETDEGVQSIEVSAVVRYTAELMGPSSWMMAKYHPWTVAVPLSSLQDWFGLDGRIEGIQVKALDPGGLASIGQRLDDYAKRSGEIYMQPIILDLDAQFKDANTFFMALYMAGLLGIALSGFVIFNSLYVSVQERRQEFAALKTIGYTPEQLRVIVLYEVLLLAAAGTAIGLLGGYGLALLLKALIFMLFGVTGESGMTIVTGLVVAALAGMLVPIAASLYPIRQVDKVSVIGALKENRAEKSKLPAWQLAAGILLIASGFFIQHLLLALPMLAGVALVYPFLFRGFAAVLKPVYRTVFGFSGNVAARNMNRNIGRTSMTSVILSLGIAMIVLMSSLNSALVQTYERIVHATYGGNLDIMFHHIEDSDVETLKATEGVADAVTYPVQPIVWTVDGEKRRLAVYGVGADWIDKFPMFAAPQGTTHGGLIGRLQDDELVLDKVAFGIWGGEIGGTVTLDTLEGPRPFKVVAVVETMKNNGFGAFMNKEHFTARFGVKYERNALVIKDGSVSPLQLRENVFGAFGTRVEEMFGPEDWVSVIGATYTGSFGVINFLIILSTLISGIGITNTLLMNIMERIRELGMMRAVGVTRGQLVRAVMLEGFGIGLAATAIGCGFGILLISMTTDFLEIGSMTFEFGVSGTILAIIVAFGLFVSLTASFMPAFRAAGTPLSEALRYE